VSEGRAFSSSFVVETFLTSKVSQIVNAGEPLNSIQIDLVLQKYKSEITPKDRRELQYEADERIHQFIKEHLAYL